MQQDGFPFGAGDTWQHSAGAVAAFALQVTIPNAPKLKEIVNETTGH